MRHRRPPSTPIFALAATFLALVACDESADSVSSEAADSAEEAARSPIVVYLVVDTLSVAAAADTGVCEVITSIAETYGTDAACVGGGLAPSSWTGESHLRMLWPENQVGARRAALDPDCDEQSSLAAISGGLGAPYVVGVQNGVLGASSAETCVDGQNAWFQGASSVHRGIGGKGDDEPFVEGIADLLAVTGTGAPAVALLNTMEAGSHTPRCTDPSTPSCIGLYELAVEYGLSKADPTDAERAAFWGDAQEYFHLFTSIEKSEDIDRAAPLMVGAIEEHLLARQDTYLTARLDALFSGLAGQGRIADLTLVVVADHGENPCFADPVSGGVNCAHTGAPSEWTANVPVVIVPASRAAAWQASGVIGESGLPWSTAAMAWGLVGAAGVPAPLDWPEPPTVGVAASWSCRAQSRHEAGPSVFGTFVSTEGSLRCTAGVCSPWSWAERLDTTAKPTALEGVPESLATYTGSPDWATAACRP